MNAGKINLLDKASGKIVTLGLAGGVTVDYVVNMPMGAGTLVTEEQLAALGIAGQLAVIDDLLSIDQVKALSANQGRILNNKIGNFKKVFELIDSQQLTLEHIGGHITSVKFGMLSRILTLPDSNSIPVLIGDTITIKAVGDGYATISCNTGEQIRGGGANGSIDSLYSGATGIYTYVGNNLWDASVSGRSEMNLVGTTLYINF